MVAAELVDMIRISFAVLVKTVTGGPLPRSTRRLRDRGVPSLVGSDTDPSAHCTAAPHHRAASTSSVHRVFSSVVCGTAIGRSLASGVGSSVTALRER
jgi:hypothetical protein